MNERQRSILRERLLTDLLTLDEDAGFWPIPEYGLPSAEDVVDRVLDVLATHGYVVVDTTESVTPDSQRASVPGRMTFTVLEKG